MHVALKLCTCTMVTSSHPLGILLPSSPSPPPSSPPPLLPPPLLPLPFPYPLPYPVPREGGSGRDEAQSQGAAAGQEGGPEERWEGLQCWWRVRVLRLPLWTICGDASGPGAKQTILQCTKVGVACAGPSHHSHVGL